MASSDAAAEFIKRLLFFLGGHGSASPTDVGQKKPKFAFGFNWKKDTTTKTILRLMCGQKLFVF